jgi:putative ABC transport system permease protein
MYWIALKMLVGDRAKFLGIVMGLTFASLLITQQGSIFCGLMLRTAAQISDITGADLWVMDSNVRFIDDVKPMLENSLQRVRGVDGVQWAVPIYKGTARAKLSTVPPPSRSSANLFTALLDRVSGQSVETLNPEPPPSRSQRLDVIEQVILLGLDDASMVGAPPPDRILVGSLTDLRKPDAVIVDRVGLRKLYPGQGWEEASAERLRSEFLKEPRELEMNDRRAVIVGICEATRTFQSNAVVYTTYSRAKQYVPRERKILSYVLAKTTPGVSPEVVARRIQAETGLGARTSDQFLWMTIRYYMVYTGIPINFLTTVLLGFVVGTAIAGQTFYNFTIENLKQFGALKAMGATNARIVSMVLLQALVVGLLGYGLGLGLAALFGWKSGGTELAYHTPWQLLPITGFAILLICVLASLVSVQRVIRLEPAIVFRG